MKLFALQLVCLLGLTFIEASSCAEDKALIITGESLVATGDQFLAVAAAMDKALESKTITVDAYRGWKAFGLKFQQAYPLVSKLWVVAADTRDEKLKAQATAAVTQLVLDLGAYAALVGVK